MRSRLTFAGPISRPFAAAAGCVLVAACSDGVTNPPSPAGDARAVLSGTLTANRTLSADTVYLIQGTTIIEDGVTLTIPAGTTLKGDVNYAGSAMIVRQGGRIVARGTADAPIVFTSSAAEGSRSRGDWGGVVLNGRSHCNFPAQECVGEGGSGPYGGSELNDDSGVLSYVRIEYAGYEVSFGNELNGLTLNGVGAGTELHHIQSHYGSDDGIEFFGGTVDLKYAVVTGASDDSFDFSTGWQGRGQFWVVIQDPFDADNGFEVDGNEENFDAIPLTNPTIYNVTLIGKPAGVGSAGESPRGIIFRRGTAGSIHNVVVLGFEKGIDLDQIETVESDGVTLTNSYFFGQTSGTFEEDEDGIDEEAYLGNVVWSNAFDTDPMLTDPYSTLAPDLRPISTSPLVSGGATPAADGFFDQVSFIGGVDPNGEQWFDAWITRDIN